MYKWVLYFLCWLSSCWHSPLWFPGGYLVQKTLRGCAANMGSNISLLVYEWPLIKCKICIWMGWFFKSSPNVSQIWLKFKKILEKLGDFAQNLAKKLERLVYEWVTFSWKIVFCMNLLSNSVAAHPYQNQTWVPPWVWFWEYSCQILTTHH